ncbi:MAG: hypothetical protein HUJ25_03845 [Crocinitomicaceae bacterium]|nr:hypothetical protein [Crocinitomicaceae bacterium]
MKNSSNKSIGKAYLFSVCVLLIPSWIGSSLISDIAEINESLPQVISAYILFALSFTGPSVGIIYFGKKLYGFISAFGRVAIVACSALLDISLMSAENATYHPYITALGVSLAFLWGMVDFIMIYFIGKKFLSREN